MKTKNEGFNEVTYVHCFDPIRLPNGKISSDQNEIMVDYENGKVVDIYTYNDSTGKRFDGWKVGKNTLFIHCPETDLKAVTTWLKFNAIKITNEEN